jgi:ankyrin repeat protein
MKHTPDHWYAFRNALYEKDFASAEKLLQETPALLNLANTIGETALHFLAVENDIDGVSWLKARGADLNSKNNFGTPVIFEVAQLEYKELFAWFVANAADIHATDSDGNDIVSYLLEYEHDEMAKWVQQLIKA